MQYIVKIQYARGPETPLAEFKYVDDAKIFIEQKLRADAALNVKATYLLCEFDEVIDKIGPNRMPASSNQGQAQGDQGQGQGKSVSFRPTPFNTTPRPPGSPPNWMREDKDDDDEKDK